MIGKLASVGARRWDLGVGSDNVNGVCMSAIRKLFKAEPILGKRLVGLMATEVPEVPGLHRLYLVMDDDSSLEIYNFQGFNLSYVSEGRGMERLRQLESGPRSEIVWVDGTVTLDHTRGGQSPPTPSPTVVPTPIKPPPPVPVPSLAKVHPPVLRGPASPPPETHPSTQYLNHLFLEGVIFYAMIKGIQMFFKCFPC